MGVSTACIVASVCLWQCIILYFLMYFITWCKQLDIINGSACLLIMMALYYVPCGLLVKSGTFHQFMWDKWNAWMSKMIRDSWQLCTWTHTHKHAHTNTYTHCVYICMCYYGNCISTYHMQHSRVILSSMHSPIIYKGRHTVYIHF